MQLSLQHRDIIVVGASAGGFDAIKKLVASLPVNLHAAIFIVWHMAPQSESVLPNVINRLRSMPAIGAYDNQLIEPGHIYIACPDRHLIIEDDHIRITRGPKENRFRPAIDALFRSAAYVYGSRVIGVILSGALDDGTAGLWTIKKRGGIAIVQDPDDAEVPAMPENAIREVPVDYILPVAEMAPLIVKLCNQKITEQKHNDMEEDKKTEREIRIALQEHVPGQGMQFGELAPFSCPECHGVLSAIKEGSLVHYRCHTGHAFSPNSLLVAITENIEQSLWDSLRGVEESISLLNHIGDHYAENNQPHYAALYFQKAREALELGQQLRKVFKSENKIDIGKPQEAGVK